MSDDSGSPSSNQVLSSAAERLASQVVELNNTVAKATEVRDELTKLSRLGKVNRILAIITFLAVIALAAVSAFLINTNMRLNEVTSKLDREVTVHRVEALCPLYQLFVNADTPQARENAKTRGDDLVARDAAFSSIKKSYATLKCEELLGK